MNSQANNPRSYLHASRIGFLRQIIDRSIGRLVSKRVASIFCLLLCSVYSIPVLAARHALIVSNWDYPLAEQNMGMGTLVGPSFDGDLMVNLLADPQTEFEVMKAYNVSPADWQDWVFPAFLARLKPADTVVIYLSGHGLEVDGENYLLPVKERFTIRIANQIMRKAIWLRGIMQDVQFHLGEEGTQILIVDACRNAPPSDAKGRSVGGYNGMELNFSGGSLVAYGTGPGRVARDSASGPSLFTQHLVRALRESPADSITEVLRDVRVGVHFASSGEQTPTSSDSLLERFCLYPTCQSPAPKPPVKLLPFEPQMVTMPAGSFRMGCIVDDDDGDCDADEKPAHDVRVPAFKLARTEVTVGQFRAFANDSGYLTEAEKNPQQGCYVWQEEDSVWDWRSATSWREPGFAQSDNHPVVCVSWNDAQAYIDWLAELTGKGYRLPTEAEWEYATRGGSANSERKYYFGSDSADLCRFGNVADQTTSSAGRAWTVHAACDDGRWYPAKVGSYASTWRGIKDLHGNVWEWVEDRWHVSYEGAPNNGSAWISGSESRRVLRGGSWGSEPPYLRAAARFWSAASGRHFNVGFRLAEDTSRH